MFLAFLCLAAVSAIGHASQDITTVNINAAVSRHQSSINHYQAAQTALMRGDVEKADFELKLALQDNPLDARSHLLFGCLLEMKGEHDQAVVAFQRALTLDSSNPEALYNFGSMLLQRGEAVPACRLLENAILIRPDHIPSWNNLAKAYYLAGLPELTVGAYEEVLRRKPLNTIALTNLLHLAEAAGLQNTASTYRQRLEIIQSGSTAKPVINAKDQIVASPIWPITVVGGGTLAPTNGPVSLVSEQVTHDDAEVDNLRDLLLDLPHVTVERRGGRLALTGWTSNKKEREMLDRIIGKSSNAQDNKATSGGAKPSEILDLTGGDTGDPDRMIEIDAVMLIMTKLDNQSEGLNLLNEINLNFDYFASDHRRDGTGYAVPPNVTGEVLGLSQQGWIFAASVDYIVNIANASDNRVMVLARPHLTTLSGVPAKFLVGGELIYSVSGINSGDINLTRSGQCSP
jgi:Tfp pilus assembly protein PilF